MQTVSKLLLSGITGCLICCFSHVQAQTLFVSNYLDGTILTVAPDGTVSAFAAGIPSAAQLVFDKNNNLYVGTGDGGGGVVAKVSPDKTVSTFATVAGGPTGIAIDNGGTLVVSSAHGQELYRISPHGVVTPFVGGLGSTPQYVTIDGQGNIYTSNNYDGTINRISPEGVVTVFASGLDRPEQLLYDSNDGDIYVAELLGNSIARIGPDGTVYPFANGIPNPDGLTLGNYGDFYVASYEDPTVDTVIWKVSPSGNVTPFASSVLFDGANGLAIQATATPEPGCLTLLTGLVGAGVICYYRRTKRSELARIAS